MPLGFIVLLEHCKVEAITAARGDPAAAQNVFHISCPASNSRVYVLSAETAAERDSWIWRIREAAAGSGSGIRVDEKDAEIAGLRRQVESLRGQLARRCAAEESRPTANAACVAGGASPLKTSCSPLPQSSSHPSEAGLLPSSPSVTVSKSHAAAVFSEREGEILSSHLNAEASANSASPNLGLGSGVDRTVDDAILLYFDIAWASDNYRRIPDKWQSDVILVVEEDGVGDEPRRIGRTELIGHLDAGADTRFAVAVKVPVSPSPASKKLRFSLLSDAAGAQDAGRFVCTADCTQDVLLDHVRAGVGEMVHLDLLCDSSRSASGVQDLEKPVGVLSIVVGPVQEPGNACDELRLHIRPWFSFVQYYRLPLGVPSSGDCQGRLVGVRETMSCSTFSFAVPYLLFQMMESEQQAIGSSLQAMEIRTDSVEETEFARLRTACATRLRSETYRAAREGLRAELRSSLHPGGAGPFRRSTRKKAPALQCVPTNCCVQEMEISCSGENDRFFAAYQTVTVGAPAAHLLGFGSSSLRKDVFNVSGASLDLSARQVAVDLIENMTVLNEKIDRLGDRLRQQLADDRDYTMLEDSAIAFAFVINELLSIVHQLSSAADQHNLVASGCDEGELIVGIGSQHATVEGTMEAMAGGVSKFIRAAREIEDSHRAMGIPEAGAVERFAKSLKQLLENAARLKSVASAIAYRQTSAPHPKDSAVERDELCISQCLTAVVTAVIHTIHGCFGEADGRDEGDLLPRCAVGRGSASGEAQGRREGWWWDCLTQVGHLVQFESLLSTFGDEKGMIADFCQSIRILQQAGVSYQFHRLTDDDVKLIEEMPDEDFYLDPVFLRIKGPLSRLKFSIGLPAAIFRNLPDALQRGDSIALHLILFSQGINEQQFIADLGGQTRLQDCINAASLRDVESHLARWRSWASTGRILGAQEAEAWKRHVGGAGDRLQRCVRERKAAGAAHRSPDILHAAAWLTRALASPVPGRSWGGAAGRHRGPQPSVTSRVVSCKSAKDRTSMSVTLEQAGLARDFYLNRVQAEKNPRVGPTDEKSLAAGTRGLLDAMRGEMGTRLRNVELNLGVPYFKGRYAFNGVQRRILGASYKPPPHVIGSAES